MKRTLSILSIWLLALLAFVPIGAQAQTGAAFSCDGVFFQIRQVGTTSRLFRVDRSTSSYNTVAVNIMANGTSNDLGVLLNGLAYNPQNGYMYALTTNGTNNTPPTSVSMYQIGQGGIQLLGTVTGLLNNIQIASGVIDRNGNYYVSSQNSAGNGTDDFNLYRFNLNAAGAAARAATPLRLRNAGNTANADLTFYDLALNPVDNKLYGVFTDGTLWSIDPTSTANRALVTTISNVSTNDDPVGTASFDVAGNLFVYTNGNVNNVNSGTFYSVNLTNGAYNFISNIDPATVSDGASCINPAQRIDVVKELLSVAPTGVNRQFDVRFSIRVQNTGTSTATNVQISDFLRGASTTAFPTASNTAIVAGSTGVTNIPATGSSTPPALAFNTAFDGTGTNADLLAGGQSLTAGQSARLTFTVRVTFPANPGVPTNVTLNTAYASSISGAQADQGHILLANGTIIPPGNLLAEDKSTNGGGLPLSANGDTPSPTPVSFTSSISGNIFEDVNYGGGAGRSQVNGFGQGVAARVELYRANGTYITSTNADDAGSYSFINGLNGVAAGTITSLTSYQVRVVSNTVVSSRPGGVAGLVPVQTFVSDGVTDFTNRVGGVAPNEADYGSRTATLPTTASDNTQEIQSIVTVTLPTAGPLVGVDFGFNFDIVNNTNDSGQGSLRQFITNANTLANTNLAQVGQTAGKEVSIFMIPNGAVTPPAGLRTGLASGLNGTGNNAGTAVITLTQALPAITGANIAIDATTQTTNIGNSNTNTVGSGGTVGTDGLTLNTIQRPEVVINANNTTQPLVVQGNAATLKGFAIYNANSTSSSSAITVASTVTGAANRAELSQLLIGTFGDGTDPGASRNRFGGVHFDGSFNFVNNYVAYNGEGVSVGNRDAVTAFAANAALITNNDLLTNGGGFGSGDNLSILASTGVQVTGNLMRNAQGTNFNYTGKGVELNNTANNNTIANNTITGNSIAGIGISQGSNNNTISRNIISGTVGSGTNTGAGVLVVTENLGGLGGLLPPTGNTITQNSIFSNNGLSIDLINSNGQGTNGGIISDGPTLNDNGDADTNLPNEMQNYPIITSASISGTNLIVKGYARAGSIIELFNVGATADPSGFGEGRTYLGTVTEGSTGDADNSTNQSYSGFINGVNQGSDNTANGFSFSIPLSSLPGGTLALGSVLSSTATLLGNTSEFSGNVVVRDLTVANDDDVTTPVNTPITFAVTANDTPTGDITTNSIDLDPNNANVQTSITTAEGTFTTVGVTAGSVKFTPTSATFTGIANTPYTVTNASGAISNQANLIVRVETKLDVATTIAGPATVLAGGLVSLTGTTKNNSLVSVTTAQSIQLPVGVSGSVTFSQNGGGVTTQPFPATTTSTGLFTFGNITLAPGATSNYTLSFNAPLGGSFTATALVNPTANDIDLSNNAAAVPVAVTPQVDLSTIITGPTANPLAGNLVSYAVTTANSSTSSPATDVVQTVQLPATGTITGVFASNGGVYSATAGSVTFNGVTYAVAARTVTFPPVSLAAGQVVNNVVGFVAPAAGTTLSVTATVPTTNDVATANNTSNTSSTTQATTTANANLYVTVTGPAQATATNVVTYTVKQGNYGPSTATAVQTVVALPANLPIATLTLNGSTGNLSGSVLTFGSGATASTYNLTTGVLTLAPEPTQTSTATEKSYDIAFAAPGNNPAISVTASVASATTDPVAGDNLATAQTEILPSADVSITLNNPSGNASVPAGQRLTYALQTQNNSDYIAQNVQQTVSLQPGLTAASLLLNGVSGTLSLGVITFGSGATASTYNVGTGLLTLPLVGSLAKGTLINNTISLVASGVNTAAGIRAVAAVTSTTPDAVPSNNSATANNGINTVEDLTVTIAGPSKAVIGNPVLYTITTTNNGPSAAGTQTTTVQLPTGLSNVEVRDNSGTVVAGAYSPTTGVVSFATTTAVPLVGQSVQGTISFNAPDNNQISLAATTGLTTTGTGNYESNIDNNTARVSTALVSPSLAPADLGTKFNANPPASLAVGASASYTIVTSNNGAATTQNAVQLISLPAGLTTTLTVNGVTGVLSAGVITYGGGINYNVSTGLLTVPSAAGIANGGSLQSIVAFPMPTTNVTVTATSVSDNPDGVTTNNIVRSSTTATSTSDVMLSMTGPASAVAGSTATYAVVVTNNGPSTATGVTATFTLPATVTTYTVNGTTTTVPAGSAVTLQPSSQTLLSGATLEYLVSYNAPTSTYTQSAVVVAAAGSNTVSTNDNGSVKTIVNVAPVANDVVNKLQTPQGNTAITGLLLTSLSGSDTDGSVASYNITSIPNTTTQGTLFYNNGGTATAVVVGQSLTTTQAGTLRFDPVSTFVGSVFFTYTATDNGNGVPGEALTSAPARYTVQVGQDNTSFYTVNDSKGGATAYVKDDEIARVYDYNGGKATNPTAAGKDIFSPNPKDRTANYGSGITDNGVRSAVAGVFTAGSAMPGKTLADIGLVFNSTTGLITVGPLVTAADRAKLKAGTYILPITTTDVNGGTNTQNVTFTIGAFPLPVELTDFTATAVKNLDAALLWHTAQEKNNDHFDVERSLNGTDFVKIAVVKGQGSKSTATEYALTDAGIGPKAQGLVYYRLKQVDTDGETSYSPVRTVSFTATSALTPAITLFPNPATTGTQLDLTSLPTGRYQVSVLDATGRVVLNTTLDAGLAHALDLNTIASGTYNVLVRGQANGQVITLTKRLIKE